MLFGVPCQYQKLLTSQEEENTTNAKKIHVLHFPEFSETRLRMAVLEAELTQNGGAPNPKSMCNSAPAQLVASGSPCSQSPTSGVQLSPRAHAQAQPPIDTAWLSPRSHAQAQPLIGAVQLSPGSLARVEAESDSTGYNFC